jgi:hypothetical protein
MSVALARQAPYPVRTAQRRCGKCGKLVSRAAYACRRCGKSQRVKPRVILLGLAGCLLVGMFAVASAGSLMGQTRPTEGSSPVSVYPLAPASSPPAAARARASTHAPEIGAAELWMAYSRDAAGTDLSFRDHQLVVNGTVRSIERDFQGRLVARLSTGDAFETVNATMAIRDDAALIGVGKGRAISLLCVGRGVSMGAPLLGGCSVR